MRCPPTQRGQNRPVEGRCPPTRPQRGHPSPPRRLALLTGLRPEWYDPEVNPLYGDVLRHYGVVALPCRVRDPDRKGKVESSVGHA
jgi:transposase